MNIILETSFNVTSELSKEDIDFNEVFSELANQLSSENMNVNENQIPDNDESMGEEEITDMIMQYTITNNTIVMMKQHEEAMKEILDE